MGIAMRRERRVREELVRRLGLPRAQYVWRTFVEEPERKRQVASPRFPVAGFFRPGDKSAKTSQMSDF
jgi:hypothetical protein